jgi:hypothetical protein
MTEFKAILVAIRSKCCVCERYLIAGETAFVEAKGGTLDRRCEACFHKIEVAPEESDPC